VDPEAAAEVIPRPAATVIALRRRSDPFEVLTVRRAREARFMGGARVFPGGALDAGDSALAVQNWVRWSGDPAELPWRAAALRELAEEVAIAVTTTGVVPAPPGAVFESLAANGLRLDGDALHYVSNWVTPRGLPIRFDTRFYLVSVDSDPAIRPDRSEVYDPVWVTPQDALGAADRGEWLVELPTRAHLEMLAAARGVDEAIAAATATTPVRVEPQVQRGADGEWTVLLPGDAGYRTS